MIRMALVASAAFGAAHLGDGLGCLVLYRHLTGSDAKRARTTWNVYVIKSAAGDPKIVYVDDP